MSPARRSLKRRDWPRGLREPRPGYYTWDHPDGRCLVIGRVPLAVARNEAMAANQHVLAARPGLLERLAGSSIHPDRISHAFTEARRLAKVPDVLPDGKLAPTFHEIRSLAKRLYDEQGNVDTKALLGHKTERMATMYANPRGSEAVRVRVG